MAPSRVVRDSSACAMSDRRVGALYVCLVFIPTQTVLAGGFWPSWSARANDTRRAGMGCRSFAGWKGGFHCLQTWFRKRMLYGDREEEHDLGGQTTGERASTPLLVPNPKAPEHAPVSPAAACRSARGHKPKCFRDAVLQCFILEIMYGGKSRISMTVRTLWARLFTTRRRCPRSHREHPDIYLIWKGTRRSRDTLGTLGYIQVRLHLTRARNSSTFGHYNPLLAGRGIR